MDLLLLPVLLQPVQAQRNPHEVHQGPRHEDHQDLRNPDGDWSRRLKHLWHDSSWRTSGGPNGAHIGAVHSKPTCAVHTKH